MTTVPTVRTLRLTLRPWREDDVEPLTAILLDPEVTRYLFGPATGITPEEAREAYGRRVATWENDGLGFWAVELNATGELIGWAGLQVSRFEKGLEGVVEVGWTLGKRWWGNGYATEAAEASLRWGFEQRGLECIYAFHAPANHRSERVMVALGMQPAPATSDIRDGAVSMVRLLTREEWSHRSGSSGIRNPHTDPQMLARVLGYDVAECWSAMSPLSAEELRYALLAGIARSWPGAGPPGEPRAYIVAVDEDISSAMIRDRAAGLAPSLVCVQIDSAEDAGMPLAELYVTTLREGVWLHADIEARHGLELDGLERADSVAFDVPATDGHRRVFVTRHPGMLDETFSAEVAGTGDAVRIG